MSWISDYYEKHFKRRLREWLVTNGVAYVLAIPLFAEWLKKQPIEVQVAAPEVLRRAFALIADKWLGG